MKNEKKTKRNPDFYHLCKNWKFLKNYAGTCYYEHTFHKFWVEKIKEYQTKSTSGSGRILGKNWSNEQKLKGS